MKCHLIYLLLAIFLGCGSSESSTKKTTAVINPYPNDLNFVKGLDNVTQNNAFDAQSSLKYVPLYDSTLFTPYELEYSVDYGTRFVKAYYKKNDIVAYLPIEFIVDYDIEAFSTKGNLILFGQYDFNKDGIKEIVIAYRDFDNVGEMIINIIQYFPPSIDKNVLCDYWISLGNLHVKSLNIDDFAYIEGNTIKVSNGESLTILNDIFTTEVKD